MKGIESMPNLQPNKEKFKSRIAQQKPIGEEVVAED